MTIVKDVAWSRNPSILCSPAQLEKQMFSLQLVHLADGCKFLLLCFVLVLVPLVLCPLLHRKALWGATCSDRVCPPESRYWLGPLGTTLIKTTGTWLEARRSVFCSLRWWSQSVMWVFGFFFPLKFYIKQFSEEGVYEYYYFCCLFHWLCICMLAEPPLLPPVLSPLVW